MISALKLPGIIIKYKKYICPTIGIIKKNNESAVWFVSWSLLTMSESDGKNTTTPYSDESAVATYKNTSKSKTKGKATHANKISTKDEINVAIQNSLTLDQFKSNVERFTAIKSLILKKQIQNYFYYPIWSRTLENFLTHINKFFWDDAIIITRLAKKESLKKALRVLEIKPEFLPQLTQPTQKKQITEKEKQECIAILKAAKERLLQQTTT